MQTYAGYMHMVTWVWVGAGGWYQGLYYFFILAVFCEIRPLTEPEAHCPTNWLAGKTQ